MEGQILPSSNRCISIEKCVFLFEEAKMSYIKPRKDPNQVHGEETKVITKRQTKQQPIKQRETKTIA